MSASFLTDIKKGTTKVSAGKIALIGNAFSVSEQWLLTGEGPMRIDETLGEYTVRTYGKNPVVKSVRAGWKNEQPAGDQQDGPQEEQPINMGDMLSATARVLESKTVYRAALVGNIRAFDKAVKNEGEMNSIREELAEIREELRSDRQEMKELILSLGGSMPVKKESQG